MEESRAILRKVGWVLVVGGVIDTGFMVYSLANQTSYSSSFSIFAVIAGVFLLRGNLHAAWIISWFTAFFIAVFAGVLIVLPFIYPFDLFMDHISANDAMGLMFIPVVIMVLLVWIFRNLTNSVVREAMDRARVNHASFWRKPSRGLWVGGCIPLLFLLFAAFSGLSTMGDTVNEAKQRAATQVGDGYEFRVKSINISSDVDGKHVHAVVTVHKSNETRDVIVKWSE